MKIWNLVKQFKAAEESTDELTPVMTYYGFGVARQQNSSLIFFMNLSFIWNLPTFPFFSYLVVFRIWWIEDNNLGSNY